MARPRLSPHADLLVRVAARIADERVARGMTQERLASSLDIAVKNLQRIESGRRSVFFAHHADYAAVTTAQFPSVEAAGFEVAPHFLLDARLMIAWAKALNERGDVERARYVAERLKEFNHAEGDKFFAACNDATTDPLPFQCAPATRSLTFEDFRGGR